MPSAQAESMWDVAIRDVTGRVRALDEQIAQLNSQRAKLMRAKHLMGLQVRDGVPWPLPDPPVGPEGA